MMTFIQNFPDYHYPAPVPRASLGFARPENFVIGVCPADRAVFSDYGSRGFLSLHPDELNWVSQYPSIASTFRAKKPSLPLSLPNEMNHPLYDRCMGNMSQKLSILQHTLEHFNRAIGKYENRKAMPELDCVKHWMKLLLAHKENKFMDIQPILSAAPEWLLKTLKLDMILEDPFIAKVNPKYTGGCLSRVKSDRKKYILFPSGKDLDHIYLKHLVSEPDGTITLSTVDSVEFDESICGVSCCQTQMQDSGIFHGEKKCAVYDIDIDNSQLKQIYVHEFEDKDRVSSACLSPFIVHEALLTLVGDQRSVFRCESNGSISTIIENYEPRFPCKEDWLHVNYGAHPRCFVLADRTCVEMHDMRVRDNNGGCDIFTISPELHHTSERIMACHQMSENPFYHLVATDYTISLMDERFTSCPVLHWRHPLRHPVQYIDVVPGVFDINGLSDMLIVGTQMYAECVCYPISVNNCTEPPKADKIPWKVSPIDEFTRLNHTLNFGSDSIVTYERLGKASLLGVCGIKHDESQTFTVLQMSSFGDLFYQQIDIIEEQGLSRTDTISLESKDLTFCKEWLYMVKKQFVESSESSSMPQSDMNCINVDASSSFHSINARYYAHERCPLCVPQEDEAFEMINVDHNGDSQDNSIHCYSCGSNVSFTQKAIQSHIQGRAISKSVYPLFSDLFNTVVGKTAAAEDLNGQLLTEIWHGNDITELVQKRNEDISASNEAIVSDKESCVEEESDIDDAVAAISILDISLGNNGTIQHSIIQDKISDSTIVDTGTSNPLGTSYPLPLAMFDSNETVTSVSQENMASMDLFPSQSTSASQENMASMDLFASQSTIAASQRKSCTDIQLYDDLDEELLRAPQISSFGLFSSQPSDYISTRTLASSQIPTNSKTETYNSTVGELSIFDWNNQSQEDLDQSQSELPSYFTSSQIPSSSRTESKSKNTKRKKFDGFF